MLLAVSYVQDLDPLGNRILSTIVASLPVLVLFYLLVQRRWLASKAGAAGAGVAILIAWLVYGMSLKMSMWSFAYGACFGLLPIGWTVFNAMLVYNVTVETGQFRNIRRSISSLSKDGRIQAVLIGFAFGAFLEGSAGSGAPVAVCGAMLVGLGFPPLRAAVICLIANTSPVAYGGLGTPIIVLSDVTGIPGETLSVMAGRQLPFLSCIIPFYMVKVMCSWRQTFQVWPALLVGGAAFAVFQYVFACFHTLPFVKGIVVYHVTDVTSSILTMGVLAVFLRFWKPKHEWHYDSPPPFTTPDPDKLIDTDPHKVDEIAHDPHAIEAAKAAAFLTDTTGDDIPLTKMEVVRAWMPYALMSVCLILVGVLRQMESKGDVWIIPNVLKSRYKIEVPTLHNEVQRAEKLQKPGLAEPENEKAEFNFIWASAAGTPVFMSAILSMLYLRTNFGQIKRIVRKTVVQMKIPIPTIACMLGLSYVTRYSGIDATLGIAFASTGILYPFFAAILGWLGVFLTGTDAGSNALFGSLQKITATEVFNNHTAAFENLSLEQTQTLLSTANSTGGVMGKMIDAQSICVATAGTNQIGREADIFKAVIWHSILLASIVGLMTLIQAYVWPFAAMVPSP
ncbi:L-lactate permease [Zavarzinella formosa]|uniref:L-lactate permease n=1 Tax=Zavarzinella formosa TaxID=360055 RepID=UPI0002EF7D89|nr:L-lactate permease [Zavarzinella formosa]